MATFTVDATHEGTLSGTSPDSVTFRLGDTVTLQNLSATVEMWVTVDGTTPVASGDRSYLMMPNTFREFRFSGVNRTAKMIGNGNRYTAESVLP